MSRKSKNAKFIAYSIAADGRLVGCEEDVSKLDLAAAAYLLAIRYPPPERAVAAQRLREIADRIEGVVR